MSNLPRTTIEVIDTRTVIDFIDTTNMDPALAHVTKEVRVNGTPVLLAEDGIQIEYGYGRVTSVTLTILPTEVHFTSDRQGQ